MFEYRSIVFCIWIATFIDFIYYLPKKMSTNDIPTSEKIEIVYRYFDKVLESRVNVCSEMLNSV